MKGERPHHRPLSHGAKGESPHPRPLSHGAREGDSPSPIGRGDRGEGKLLTRPGLLALCGLVLLALLLLSPFHTHAQSPIQVGLVVHFGEGNVITRCVTLNQSNPTGWDVLAAANLGVVGSPSGMGMAVCKIGEIGCPAENCWCRFNSGENLYWSYWHLQDGRWVYSNLGASNYPVSQGAVEGWIWGTGRTPPPIFTYEQICAPQPAATFTFTPLPTVTFTFTSSPTATFTSVAMSTATPVFSPTPTYTAILPTATMTELPTVSPIPRTPTAQPVNQLPLRTPTLTPSPTITLPFAVAMAATTVAPSQNLPHSQASPQGEVALDLQSISLTATAVEASRQSELLEENGNPEDALSQSSFGFGSLDVAYLVFFAIAGGLLGLLIILVRRRNAQ